MKILLVNGSGGSNSTTKRLLTSFSTLFPQYKFQYAENLQNLPLFNVDIKDSAKEKIAPWLKAIKDCDALVIATPEYLHNIPAMLKNALEWTTESGVIDNKTVIALTYTPYAPRGEKAMQSLLYSLEALNAKVALQLPLYHGDLFIEKDGQVTDKGGIEMLSEALQLLTQ